MTALGLCLEFADESYDTYDELWQIIDLMADGKEKDLLLIHLLKTAETEEIYFGIFFATPNEHIQDLALMAILAMTHDITVVRKVQKFASECVQKFADIKFDLMSLQQLKSPDIKNNMRLAIARQSPSAECRRYALSEVLTHDPTLPEVLSVFNHPDGYHSLRKEAEYLLAHARVVS